MKSPLLLVGLAGAAYFATRKKPAKATTSKTTEKTLPKVEEKDEEEKLPEVKDDVNLPQVDEKEDNLNVEEIDNKDNAVTQYYDPYFSENNLVPMIMDAKTIWISNDCLSWGVGKEYKLALPEKYLYAQPTNPDKLVTPWEWWNKVGGAMSPAPWYLNSYQGDSPARAFAANIIDFWNKCPISPPRRKDFKSYNEYRIVINKFVQTPLGTLFSFLVDHVTDEMYAGWENKYPNEALLEIYKGHALKAIIDFPKKTIDEQTSIAYHWAFDEDPDAPKKIDPKNLAHKPYLSAWQRINIEVKNYKGLIKQYGL